MKERDLFAQPILDVIAAGVGLDHVPRRQGCRLVVGQEEGRGLRSQAGDDDLTHGTLVIVEVNRLIHVADLATLVLGLGDVALLPGRGRQTFHPCQHARAPTPYGDEADAILVQAVQAGVGRGPRIEQQTRRILSGLLFPVACELRDQAIGVRTQHVGRGVTYDSPTRRLSYKRHHRRQSTVAQRHPVLFQVGLVTAKWDGVEVEVEGVRRVPQGRFGDQGRDEAFVHAAFGAVGIVCGVGGLGQHIESGPQSGPFIGTQIAYMADAAVTQQLRQQQGQKGLQGRHGLRTGQARLPHRVGQLQSEQLWDEQKQSGHLGGELPPVAQVQVLHVGHGGHQ